MTQIALHANQQIARGPNLTPNSFTNKNPPPALTEGGARKCEQLSLALRVQDSNIELSVNTVDHDILQTFDVVDTYYHSRRNCVMRVETAPVLANKSISNRLVP